MSKKTVTLFLLFVVLLLSVAAPVLAEDSKKFVRRKDKRKLTVAKILAASQLKPTLFYATTSKNCYCIMARCKASDPIIEAIRKRFGDQITILTLNHFKQADEFDLISETYAISDLPGLLLFEKEQLILKQVGFINKKEVEKKIQKLLQRP